MYERLQSEMTIGRLRVANRVVMPAMGVNLAAAEGGVTDDIIAFYEARAAGGAGLIITEVTRVTGGAGISDPCQLSACGAADVPGLQRLVDAVHKYDTRRFIQLQHPAREASPQIAGEQPVAPSAVKNPLSGGGVPRELSAEECAELAEKFADAALYSQMAGADGVELHAAHGYLINEFLSPAMNFRSDRYGGGFENRMRFVREIIAAIRERCGISYPISVRINAEEALPGGIDLKEAAKIAAALEEAGAAAINVSCYSGGCIEPGTYEEGWKSYMAEAVKKAVSIPVIAVCNIKEPRTAEGLLERGVCDFVGVGRGHLADPRWCRKAFSGRDDEIRRCIGCLACFGEIVKCRRVKCAVNPLTGREREFAHPVKNGAGRPVAVIGGGPAGIEAALTLKERGFAPVIFEEADATVDSVAASAPCGVFVACGAEPLVPPLPGIDGKNVCTAEDVLLGRVSPRGPVAVIGSGMTGLETAEMLAAAGCPLTVVEMLPSLGPGMYPAVVEDVMSRITPHKPQLLTGHRLERVTERGVELTRLYDGESVFVEADFIVLAMGVRPRKKTVDEFKAAFGDVVAIGDARRGGRILEATQDARGRAFTFMADE